MAVLRGVPIRQRAFRTSSIISWIYVRFTGAALYRTAGLLQTPEVLMKEKKRWVMSAM